MNDQQLEQDIQAKGLTAPRVTPERIKHLLSLVTYSFHVVPGTTTTMCTAIDKNGFTLATEISACASPENFNEEIGRKAAQQKAEQSARNQLWVLEGYALKQRLSGDVL